MICRDSLVARLLALPKELGQIERDVIEAESQRRHAAGVLQSREDTLLLTDIEGKNAEQRSARLRVATVTERLLLEHAENSLQLTKALLREVQAEHSSLRAVSRLLAAERD
jgi:hypothetical protein